MHSPEYAKRHAKLSALRPWTLACLKDLCLLLSLPRDGKKADLVERIMQFLVQPPPSDVKTTASKKKSRKAMASNVVLPVGTRVDGLFEGDLGGELWYPGQITKVHANGTYDISYDDGDAETEVPGKYIHYVPDSDDASATKNDEASPGATDASEETKDTNGSDE